MANDDSISQDEIDNLMDGLEVGASESGVGVGLGAGEADNGLLSRADQSTILEVHNIAFGAAASTLSVILGQDVALAPLRLTEYDSLGELPEPFEGDAKFVVGLHYEGSMNIMSAAIFRAAELKSLAIQMMAQVMPDAPPSDGAPDVLSDMEMDAAKEALNQFFHASSTSISSILSKPTAVSLTPIAPYNTDQLAAAIGERASEKVIAVDYTFEWGDMPQFSMCQILTTAGSRGLVQEMMTLQPEEKGTSPEDMMGGSSHAPPQQAGGGPTQQMYGQPQPMMAQNQMPFGGQPGMQNPVTVQPVQFQPLDGQGSFYGEMNKNLELVMDVALSLTVELGKTEISIKEVLELTRGSVIELDRVAGEPVDLLANGKLIAKGEVVVIEDNFGLRITSIVSPADRLRGL